VSPPRWRGRRRGAPHAVAPARREAALREALEALLDERPGAAAERLAELVREDSRSSSLYLLLGRLYRRAGDVGRSIRVHRNLLVRSDVDEDLRGRALLELGRDLRAGGFLERAAASLEEARERAPRSAAVLRELVDLQAERGDWRAALDAFRHWVRAARPERDEAAREEASLWVRRAEAERAVGHEGEARRAVRRALRRDPGSAEAHLLLGHLEAERGRSRAALKAWRAVPRLDPERGGEAWPLVASAFAAVGRSRDHEAGLRSHLETRPDDAEARMALARALAARGEVDGALGELRALLDRRPDHLDARVERGRLLLAEHRDPDALKELGELLAVLEGQGASGPGAGGEGRS